MAFSEFMVWRRPKRNWYDSPFVVLTAQSKADAIRTAEARWPEDFVADSRRYCTPEACLFEQNKVHRI
jgi:hypothetical protein